jgi:hypothetical protein
VVVRLPEHAIIVTMSDAIGKLQQAIFREYASGVDLPVDAHYFGGARLRFDVLLTNPGQSGASS